MSRQKSTLFYSAIGISAVMHLALLWLLPYRPFRLPRQPDRRLIPVELVQRPPERPAATPAPLKKKPLSIDEPARSVNEAEAHPFEPMPEPSPISAEAPPDTPATLGEPSPAAPAADQVSTGASLEPEALGAAEDTTGKAPPPAGGSGAEGNNGEMAAYANILSALRGRIVESIRYPTLARVKGWQGTVHLLVRLDADGRLQDVVVRRSSGYEVLDKAAAALLRKVTPIANPLSHAVNIEIPIVFELK